MSDKPLPLSVSSNTQLFVLYGYLALVSSQRPSQRLLCILLFDFYEQIKDLRGIFLLQSLVTHPINMNMHRKALLLKFIFYLNVLIPSVAKVLKNICYFPKTYSFMLSMLGISRFAKTSDELSIVPVIIVVGGFN